MRLVLALLIIKAYEDKNSKCGPTDRTERFLSNGEIFSLQTNFCTELEQFCCSSSAALACIWNSRPDNKCNVFQKFVFPHQRCYGTKKIARELDQGYLPDQHQHISTCVWRAKVPTVGGDRARRSVFFRITSVEQQIGISEYFLLGFDLLRSFELSNSLIAHRIKGQWRGHNYALPPHLVVNTGPKHIIIICPTSPMHCFSLIFSHIR